MAPTLNLAALRKQISTGIALAQLEDGTPCGTDPNRPKRARVLTEKGANYGRSL
jgi:hypothetical protein